MASDGNWQWGILLGFNTTRDNSKVRDAAKKERKKTLAIQEGLKTLAKMKMREK